MSCKFSGGKELEAAFRELGQDRSINAAAREALRDGARPIADLAASLAPEHDGFLKKAIKVAAAKRQKGKDYIGVMVGIDRSVDPPSMKPRQGGGTYRDPGVAGHSVMVEFGTGNMAAQPYMTPAMEAEMPNATPRVIKRLGPAIERAAARLAKRRAKG